MIILRSWRKRLSVYALLGSFAISVPWGELWVWSLSETRYSRGGGKARKRAWVVRERVSRFDLDARGKPRVIAYEKWYAETGLRWKLGVESQTYFKPSGDVWYQRNASAEFKGCAPWWWSVGDDRGGSAPWVRAGLSLEEWWEAIPDSKKPPELEPPGPRGTIGCAIVSGCTPPSRSDGPSRSDAVP